jgi:hypothetical protein
MLRGTCRYLPSMKIRLGQLRRLVRESMRDTMPAPTQLADASPESMRKGADTSLKSHNPVTMKAAAVLKALRAQGHDASPNDVKRFMSSLSPGRALVLTADAIAASYLKKTSS